MQQRLAVLLLVGLVALSGCSVLESGDSADSNQFTESVEFAAVGVAGEPVEVQVQAENIGNSTANYVATLRVDGENATTESVMLDTRERTTVTLATTIDDAGEYNLTVAGQEQAITIHESALDLLRDIERDPSATSIVEEETEGGGVAEIEGQEYDFSLEATATERTNYTAETQYTIENSTSTIMGQTSEETTEEWVVNGTLYEKTTDQTSGDVAYISEPSDEFEDDTDFSDDNLQKFLSMEHRDGEYEFTLSASSSSEAAQLWAALGVEDAEIPPERVQGVTMEFRVDPMTGRQTSTEIEVLITNFDIFTNLDMTIQREVVAVNEPVVVSVPDDVRENAQSEEPVFSASG